MCTALLPQGVNPIAVNKYISYNIISYIYIYNFSAYVTQKNYVSIKNQVFNDTQGNNSFVFRKPHETHARTHARTVNKIF